MNDKVISLLKIVLDAYLQIVAESVKPGKKIVTDLRLDEAGKVTALFE